MIYEAETEIIGIAHRGAVPCALSPLGSSKGALAFTCAENSGVMLIDACYSFEADILRRPYLR